MKKTEWFSERDSRTRAYPGARLIDPNRSIHLDAPGPAIESYSGQVTLIVLCNLLSRMARKVSISLPQVPIVSPLPWAGARLDEYLLQLLHEASPFGEFALRSFREGDTLITVGPAGTAPVVHGAGWSSYFGPAPSLLADTPETHNPIGPAFAAISAIASLYHTDFGPSISPTVIDTLTWCRGEASRSDFVQDPELGHLWAIGVGSVGSALLYFLTLANRSFRPTLFDMDDVQIHNLDRSPLFDDQHVGRKKVDVVADYLRSAGCKGVSAIPTAFHKAEEFKARPAGTPDVFLSAANELNVRSIIEDSYPPLQIYGTTGRSWQASLLRHVPGRDPCSCCVFPPENYRPTACATTQAPTSSKTTQVDAAVPFLSFAAGLMAAAEIFKLHLDGYPFSTNRVAYYSKTEGFTHAPLYPREHCICQSRNTAVHRAALRGAAYSTHSPF